MFPPIQIFICGTPAGQPRVKATIRGKHAGVYTPDTIVNKRTGAKRPHPATLWKAAIADQWLKSHVPLKREGPLCVNLTFYFGRPKSHFRKNGELKPNAPEWHTTKPDRDNLEKCVLDTLTRLGVMIDDKQVCDGRVRKFYANGGATGCEIILKEADLLPLV